MRSRRRLDLAFLHLNLGPIRSAIRTPGDAGTREAKAFTRLGSSAAKIAEAPPDVVKVDGFASADHHSLDGVAELHEGSVDGHVALNVVDEPPHGEEPTPSMLRSVGGVWLTSEKAATMEPDERRACGLLLHPLAVLSVVVLLGNDHLLKAAAPGLLTGKLSDVAGLVVFPLLLAEVAAVIARRMLRRPIEARALVLAAVLITAAGFSAVKTSNVAADLWAGGLGALQWLVGFGFARGGPPPSTVVAVDPTDLVALPALLVAVLIARKRRQPRPGRAVEAGSPMPRRWLRTNRFAGVAMALITALSSIATQPSTNHVASSIEEHFQLDASFVVVRHVAWTVTNVATDPFRALALTATIGRAPSTDDMCQGATLPGVEVRVVPDNPDLATPVQKPGGCEPAGIDLTETCATGCIGGATVLVEFEYHKDFAAKQTDAFISLSGGVYGNSGGTLELVADPRPGEDSPPAVETTGLLAYPFDVGPRNPSAELHAVLRVPAGALQKPLDGLHGRIRVLFWSVDVKSGFGTVQTLTLGALEPYRPDSVMGSAQVEIDWLRQCTAGEDCEIPLTLHVETPRSGPNAPSPDPQTRQDFWRWGLEASLIALDGRTLPPDSLRIDGPSDPIKPS
jgi:hypothetical protein